MSKFREYLQTIGESKIGVNSKLFNAIEEYLDSKTIISEVHGYTIEIIPSEDTKDATRNNIKAISSDELTNNIIQIAERILKIKYSKDFKQKLQIYINLRNRETTGNDFDDICGWHVEKRKVIDQLKMNLVINDLVNMLLNYK